MFEQDRARNELYCTYIMECQLACEFDIELVHRTTLPLVNVGPDCRSNLQVEDRKGVDRKTTIGE